MIDYKAREGWSNTAYMAIAMQSKGKLDSKNGESEMYKPKNINGKDFDFCLINIINNTKEQTEYGNVPLSKDKENMEWFARTVVFAVKSYFPNFFDYISVKDFCVRLFDTVKNKELDYYSEIESAYNSCCIK